MLVAPVACFVWQFRRVRNGRSSRAQGILRYVGWSSAPLLIFVGLFFVMVGVEELVGVSLVGEGYARSLVLLGGGGLAWVAVGAIVFAISVMLVKR